MAQSDEIAALTAYIHRLEAALRGVVNANQAFLREVPHMRNEPAHDPISKACNLAMLVIYPEAEL